MIPAGKTPSARPDRVIEPQPLKHKEDIVDGLENAPEAFLGMQDGKNFGKLLVRVS